MNRLEAQTIDDCTTDTRTVEVFRTTVASTSAAGLLLQQLRNRFPGWRINFDLDDCDRILRVETPGDTMDHGFITGLLLRSGYHCEPLPD